MTWKLLTIKILVGVILFFPSSVFASSECLSKGYTVIFINGIFNTKDQALESKRALELTLGSGPNNEQIKIALGYNPSHIAGLGDVLQTAIQGFATSISTFDRDTILLQIHPEIATRKVLLVGHSQGTFYTNNIYDYLLSHGEPAPAVGVYNVATPANYVAGGGKYLTSNFDSIIKAYADYTTQVGALSPLPPNAYLGVGSSAGNGHSFVDNYLAYGGERMVLEIQQGLSSLMAEEGTATDGCFTLPQSRLGYTAKQAFFVVADTTAVGIKTVAVAGFKGAALVVGGVKSGLAAVGSLFGSTADAVTPPPRTTNVPGSHDVVRAIYGSSVTESDLKDLLGASQGGAVALAVPKPPVQTGEVLGAATERAVAPPLVPPTNMFALPSPGYGGGGGGGGSSGSDSVAPAQAAQTAPTPAQPMLVTYTFNIIDIHEVSAVCAFDTDTAVPCGGSFSATLEPGPHTFTITATDAVGNQSTKTKHFTVE